MYIYSREANTMKIQSLHERTYKSRKAHEMSYCFL